VTLWRHLAAGVKNTLVTLEYIQLCRFVGELRVYNL
jgi:hypothetical protein